MTALSCGVPSQRGFRHRRAVTHQISATPIDPDAFAVCRYALDSNGIVVMLEIGSCRQQTIRPPGQSGSNL